MRDMPHDIETIRNDFVELNDGTYHYLDTAATSLTPRPVLDAVNAYYETYRANVHQGMFDEALKATASYEEGRQSIAQFICAPSAKEVIITSGATEASNMLFRMLEESGVLSGDNKKNLVTTTMEHHSTFLPLERLARRMHKELRVIPLLGHALDYEKAETLITHETALVVVMLASNVTGMINDVRRIADLAHAHGAQVVVDATACAGHIPINVTSLGADALYFSGHKMFAPTGVGALFVTMPLLLRLEPSIFGGHMVARIEGETPVWSQIPERFEAGTKNISGVIGLGRAIAYINEIGLDRIRKHTAMLACYTIHKLEQIPGIRVYSSCDGEKNIGIVSFSCDFAHPHDVADILANDRVAVRPGHHCAILLHDALGVPATTRASFHIYNTRADADALILGVKKARNIFS